MREMEVGGRGRTVRYGLVGFTQRADVVQRQALSLSLTSRGTMGTLSPRPELSEKACVRRYARFYSEHDSILRYATS